jgi:hypothetical protein
MSPRGRKDTPAQKKARRQKQIAIGGAVLLVVLGAWEVPKVLKHGKSASAVTTTASATPPDGSASGSDVAPAANTATPVSAAVPAVSAKLPDESGPTASTGQLVSFSVFRSKDPFKQQLVEDAGSGSSSGSGTTSPPSTSPPASGGSSAPPVSTSPAPVETSPVDTTPVDPTPVGTTPVDTTPVGTTPVETTPTETGPTETTSPPSTSPPTTTLPPPPPPKPISAKIEVNGVAEDVTIGDAFPKAQPLFRLISIKDGVARVGISGGTLQGSSQTVPLVQGKTLTLMNTADGMRYVLKLVSVAYVAS